MISATQQPIYDITSNIRTNNNQQKDILQRRLKVLQRELLVSNVRLNCCSSSKHSRNLHVTLQKSSLHQQDLIQKHYKMLNKIRKESKRKRLPISYQDLSNLVSDLDMEWNDFSTIFKTTRRFRKLLSIQNPPIDKVIQSGAISYLVQYLDLDQFHKCFNVDYFGSCSSAIKAGTHDPSKKTICASKLHKLQYEATWAMTNIASGTTDHTRYLVDIGCIPLIINLLNVENDNLKQQSLWVLGNISADSIMMRNLILDQGALPILLKILESEISDKMVTRNTTWVVSNLLKYKPSPSWEIISATIPVLLNILCDSSDDEVSNEACLGIGYVLDEQNTIQVVIEHDQAMRKIIELLHHNTTVPFALNVIGLLFEIGTNVQTETVLDSYTLYNLSNLLTHPLQNIRKQVMCIFVNIMAGTIKQVQRVIDANIIPKIIAIIQSDSEAVEVVIEAYWALSNLTSISTEEQTNYAIDQGIVPVFCDGLLKANLDVMLMLKGIQNLLWYANERKNLNVKDSIIGVIRERGCVEKMEELKSHSDDEQIKQKCIEILEGYL